METKSPESLLSRIQELEERLAEAEQLIEAIKAGEVDAFAFNKNNQSEVFTLQSGDYAYRVLVENFSEGALNLSEEGLIVYTNSYFHELLKLPYDKVIGNSVFEFIHPDSKEIFNELFRKGLAGQAKGEINLIARKKIIPVYVSLTSLYPTLPTVGMIVTDLTEKKQITELKKTAEADSKLAAIIQSSEDAIIGKTLDGIVTSWNPGAEKTFGYTAEEMIGQPILKLIPTDRQHEEPAILKKIREGKVVDHFETQRVTKNGKLLDISLTISPVKDHDGKITGASKIARDITAQKLSAKKIEESEKKYRTIFNTAAVSLWEEDFTALKAAIDELKQQGIKDFRKYFSEHPEFVTQAMSLIRVIDVNEATVKMFEAKDKDELLGSLPKIFTPESLPVFIEELVALAEGRTHMEAEALLHSVRGNPVHILFTMKLPLPSEKFDRVLFSCLDISERKKAEVVLHEAEKRKDDFMQMASHELKTPITTIKAYTQLMSSMLNEKAEGIEPTLFKSSLDKVEKQVSHMERLLIELLDWGRIESGKLEIRPEEFSINELVAEVIQEALVTKPRQAINLSQEFKGKVNADRDHIGQVVNNLLSNAIKYSPEASKIDVTIHQPEKNKVAVSIRDYGIGISEKDQPKIFERFFRTQEAIKRKGSSGFGIGLFVASEIMKRHNGSLTVESQQGKGSMFTFTLPAL